MPKKRQAAAAARTKKTRRKFDWVAIRQYAEITPGATYQQVADKFGCSKTAVRKHAHAENWSRCVEISIAAELARKLSGVLEPTCDPEAYAKAVEAEAELRAQRIWVHRERWGRVSKQLAQIQGELEETGKQARELNAMTPADRQSVLEDEDDPRANLYQHFDVLSRQLRLWQSVARQLEIVQRGEARAWKLDVEIGDLSDYERQKLAAEQAERNFWLEVQRSNEALGDAAGPMPAGAPKASDTKH